MIRTAFAAAALAIVFSGAASAQSVAQRFEAGVHVGSVSSGQFDSNDVGFGGRIAWRPAALFGVEGEVSLYPGEFPNDRAGFSRDRIEGLFGVTFGPQFGSVRPFAKIRPGFLRVQGASEPIACILIFPPPLSCTLASGRTLFAADLGGGVDVAVGRRTFLRFDIGDRMVRYPGPAFDSNRRVHDAAFMGHDFRLTGGGGLRF